ncbi:Phosphatase [Roseivivax sp. THAF40]|uniref:HAD family hydrolase n=1 Tax=unclassified Roseivivax TaxID=2639302 RepID=UPI0012680F7E|nr:MULTISPECIES: HAD-IA family hydrolase [unclassified Roseivivax]QFS81452.1 Phosphatase [Roseivivax sp. THAF197b]QFT45181.1 Phosphatase [Roseivivax sp. THAF40]
MTRYDLHLVAWDFDGVLNDGFRDGRAIWADNFERDLGHPISSFRDHFFGDRFEAVVTGREDLRAAVADWADKVGYAHGADTVIRYWFEQDRHPVPAMLERLDRLADRGMRQVIATNNEAHRARFIEDEMGYGTRVETVFASGRMGLRKPDPRFFHHIAAETGVTPGNILLVDDLEENIAAARDAGWQGYHLTDIHENDLDAVLGLR